MNMTIDDVKIKKDWTLTAQDRCDRCSAEALVKVTGVTGDIYFCGHHYNSIMNDEFGYKKMMDFMFEIVDERDKLIENRIGEE